MMRSLFAIAVAGMLSAGCGAPPPAPAQPTPQVADTPAMGESDDLAKPASVENVPVANAAPTFSLSDLEGKQVSLASLRGRTVVVEWFNPGCPFIKWAHGKGPLKDPPAASDDVVWLAINSSAPGLQGHGLELNKAAHSEWSMPYPVLIDEDGTVGKAWGAKTTPHMFIVDPNGSIVYRGALDNAPFGQQTGDTYTNYVTAALGELAAGRPVKSAETQPYGCSVKYGK